MNDHTDTPAEQEDKPRSRGGRPPGSTNDRTPRLTLTLDDAAKAVLANFATLNGLGFAPTVAEVLARASQVACADIATHYEQATAKLRKIEN